MRLTPQLCRAFGLLTGALVVSFAPGCGGGSRVPVRSRTGVAVVRAAPAPPGAPRCEGVARLPLAERVGQTVVLSFDGPTVPPYVARALRAGEVSGVILFADNATGPAQTRALTAALSRAAGGPALVMLDQEGGPVRTAPWLGPTAGEAASARSPASIEAGARRAGRELRRAGITVDLAPVADVAGPSSALSARAFPGGAAAVAARTAAMVIGLDAAGIGATAKHYPGLGAAAANTDAGAVTIARTAGELGEVDLEPFRAAVAAGVPLVMVGHARYPALDPAAIASQSAPIIEGLLRGRLGFRGVVITDSLEAVAVPRPVAGAALRSLGAGADLLLTTGRGSFRPVSDRLLAAARGSVAVRARLDQAAARVLVLKRRLGVAPPPGTACATTAASR